MCCRKRGAKTVTGKNCRRVAFGRFTALSHVCTMELLNDVLANIISAVIVSASGYIMSWAFKKNPFQ